MSDSRKKSSKAAGGKGKARHNVVAAAEFKATCLELLDRVRERGVDYVVTKHGRPVARVVSYHAPSQGPSFFGAMKGTVLQYDRPFDPIDGEYAINRS